MNADYLLEALANIKKSLRALCINHDQHDVLDRNFSAIEAAVHNYIAMMVKPKE